MSARLAPLLALAVLLACCAAGAAGPRRPAVVLDERVRVFVDVVRTPAERARGLSGRAGLDEHEGMLFLFDQPGLQSFWMKDMRFEIDILWIRGDKLIGVAANAKLPTRGAALPLYRSPEPCDRVLEVRAGSAARWGLAIGDAVRIEP